MYANRILNVLLGLVAFGVVPVQIISTLVLGIAVELTFGLLLLPISIIWMFLFFPLLGVSWICSKVPGLREVLGFIFIPWAIVTNTFVALMPSMGELEGRVSKLMLVGAWPFTWEFSRFLRRRLELDSPDLESIALNEVVHRMSKHVPIMQRVVLRITAGQQLDPNIS